MSCIRTTCFAILLTSLYTWHPSLSYSQYDRKTPEKVARDYIEALHSSDLEGMTDLMHPDALDQFKQMFREIVALDTAGTIAVSMFGLTDSTEFGQQSPRQLFTSLMRTTLSSIQQTLASGFAYDIIGSVMDDSSAICYVVYRTRFQEEEFQFTEVSVLPLRKNNDLWGVLLTGDMEGIAAFMAKQVRKK